MKVLITSISSSFCSKCACIRAAQRGRHGSNNGAMPTTIYGTNWRMNGSASTNVSSRASKKQGSAGPQSQRMESAWSYVGKREAMGGVGILKAMGLAITGVVDTAIWFNWKLYGGTLRETLKRVGVDIPENAPQISKYVDKSYDETAALLAETMGVDAKEKLFAGMSAYEFGATAGKVPAALMLGGALSKAGAAGQAIGLTQTAQQAEGLYDNVRKLRAGPPPMSWSDIFSKPEVWLQIVGVVAGAIGSAGSFAQAESEAFKALQKIGAVANAGQVSVMVAAYLALDDDPKLSADEKSKRKAELLADMVSTTAMMINDRYGKGFEDAWTRRLQQGRSGSSTATHSAEAPSAAQTPGETKTSEAAVPLEPVNAREPAAQAPNAGERPVRSPATGDRTSPGSMSLEVHPDMPNVMVDTTIEGLQFEHLLTELERTPQGEAIAEKIRSGELHVTITGEPIIKGWVGAQIGREVHVTWRGPIQETASTLVHEGAHFIDNPIPGQSEPLALFARASARAIRVRVIAPETGLPAYDATEQAYRDAFDQTLSSTGDKRAARIAADRAMLDAMRTRPAVTGVAGPAKEAGHPETPRQGSATEPAFDFTQPGTALPETVSNRPGTDEGGVLASKVKDVPQLTSEQTERLRALEAFGLQSRCARAT